MLQQTSTTLNNNRTPIYVKRQKHLTYLIGLMQSFIPDNIHKHLFLSSIFPVNHDLTLAWHLEIVRVNHLRCCGYHPPLVVPAPLSLILQTVQEWFWHHAVCTSTCRKAFKAKWWRVAQSLAGKLSPCL